MIDISVKNLIKSFEVGENILDGLSFEVDSGERVGILGANGSGKTTLFRLLVGELHPDEGEIAIAPGKRLGLISQIPRYPAHYTTEDVLKEAHRALDEISARMKELERRMELGDSTRATLEEYDRLSESFTRRGGYNTEIERNRVCNGLDIPADMRARPFDALSGGEKTRVNLARLILEDTDILLLDEPTNHLDMQATEWLEEYLRHFKGTVLAISHDRWFLDRVAQRVIEIENGKAQFYSGNYSFYVQEKRRRFEEQLKKYEKDQAKLRQLEAAADKLHLWAFMGNDKLHKRAFSMEKRMEKLSRTERPKTERKLTARFGEREFMGDEVLTMEGLSKSFGERRLFSDLEALVTAGERIALIGENGCGKSTLIKLIMGELLPDGGYVRLGPSVKCGYLPQIIRFEHPERSLYDTMLYECKCTPQAARDRLGAFKFRGDDVFKPVSVLSGGEQSRLRLCMLMENEINLLILDEPTNHLDLASREWVEDALSDYSEALLFVSHDRYFIDRFATRVWDLRDGHITDFFGSFAQFREFRARQTALEQSAKAEEKKKSEKKDTRPKRPVNAEKQLAKVERDIAKYEAELARIDAETEASAADYQRLLTLAKERVPIEAALEALYEQWEALSE